MFCHCHVLDLVEKIQESSGIVEISKFCKVNTCYTLAKEFRSQCHILLLFIVLMVEAGGWGRRPGSLGAKKLRPMSKGGQIMDAIVGKRGIH